MGCTSCSTGKGDSGQPKGCQNNGTCGTDSCNKMTVFDWLSNMVYPSGTALYNVVEVRFKNGRKDFYKNQDGLTLSIGDIIATEAASGHDIGIVTLTGELVKVQMKKKKVDAKGPLLKVYRKATQKDIDIWQACRNREEPMKVRARELAISLRLEMKISDIEFQGDSSKATFYYTANERVDFRQLIKDFAKEFNIRIEMKQVGFRQEAARLGGIGSCGRELCCSTWLTDFRSVNTSAARYQQLSLNPQKLAGQCGKLKCCLNYELDTYMEAIKHMPDADTKLFTVKGIAFCQKVDIFKGQMWFAYANNSANWYVLSAEQVREIVEMNQRDEKANELESYVEEVVTEEKNFQNAVGQDSVTRFDQPKRKKRPVRKKKATEDITVSRSPKKETATKVKERNTVNKVDKEIEKEETVGGKTVRKNNNSNNRNRKPKNTNSNPDNQADRDKK